jgi:hypothetical protein
MLLCFYVFKFVMDKECRTQGEIKMSTQLWSGYLKGKGHSGPCINGAARGEGENSTMYIRQKA